VPRNLSGTYVLPANSWNPAIPDTTITAEDWNSTADDLALALTQSIASNGETTTTQPIPFAQGLLASSGLLATPGIAFIGDANTGFYRPAADQLSGVCGGVAFMVATSTGVTFPLGASISGGTVQIANGTVTAPSLSFASDTNTGLYRVGADSIGLTCAGANVLVLATTGATVTGALTVSTNLTANGNVILGDAGTDTVTVNGAATFASTATFTGTLTANGNAVLGSDNADTLTVNAVATFVADTILADTAPTSVRSAGFRGAPLETQDANYSFGLPDAGQTIRHTSGSAHAWTIEPDSTTNFPIGTTIVIRNVGSGIVTLTRGSGVVLRIGGVTTDSNKSFAQWGLATLLKEAADTWVVSGAGVT
jgi:hypothetical protein